MNIYGQTDQDGIVDFRLPEGTYKFRADHQGNQYWATEPIDAHQVNVITLNTGGGEFTLTVEKQAGSPLIDVPVYVFSSGGSYLGLNAHTDDQGEVTFDLSDGDYKFRTDHLGCQFWTDVYNIPATLSETLTIPHQDVTITVQKIFQGEPGPLEGLNV
ncbi:MAG: Ig-like domain-containing protein, partial [Deltaproteobacteria bacterium]|nr:Ig-like domain-containing protein [Deltaproteobacteria bacterium]